MEFSFWLTIEWTKLPQGPYFPSGRMKLERIGGHILPGRRLSPDEAEPS